MAVYSGYVAAGNDDWDELHGSGGTTIQPQYNNSAGAGRAYGIFRIDTEGPMSGAGVTIDSAVLHWYDHDYDKNKSDTQQGTIQIYDGSAYDTIYAISSWSTGWKSHALTSAEIESVVTTGGTEFRVSVDDPGSTWDRVWYIRAYEYTGSYEPYLVIAYTVAAGNPRKRTIMIT